MSQDQVMPGMHSSRLRGMDEEQPAARPGIVGIVIKIVVGLVIAADASLLAAPLYYGTVRPCSMVALSRASMHSRAVDEEIGIADEMPLDVFYASLVWVRSQESFASCAGDIGGRTLSSLFP